MARIDVGEIPLDELPIAPLHLTRRFLRWLHLHAHHQTQEALADEAIEQHPKLLRPVRAPVHRGCNPRPHLHDE